MLGLRMVPLFYPRAPEVGKCKTREVIYHTDMNRTSISDDYGKPNMVINEL